MVLSKLKKNNVHLPETLVGMENHMKNLKGMLNSDSNGVGVIGILGMSGLGKTTVAKAFYNEFNELFDYHCFLEDVGGKSQHNNGLISLQKQLLSKIINIIPDFDDVDDGANTIKDVILGKKVFIILDNVNAKHQVEKLAVNHNWYLYGAGSRIIVTTTNEEVLLASEVTCHYKLKPMEDSDAFNLFCKLAFKRDSPLEGFHSLTKEIVCNAGGLPLVLVTLGSLLSIEKDIGSWEAIFKKLKAIPRREVLERLRISYDALDDHQKQIFLDIACFFAGAHKENPFYMWDACNFYPTEGIKTLVRRSLITVREDDNILRMHDQLIKLGRQIVKGNLADPGEWTRLWDHDEALETLKKLPGLKNVEALCLDFQKFKYFYSRVDPKNSTSRLNSSYPRLAGQDFAKLPKLRYLSVAFADLDGDFNDLHSELRWLEWQGCSGNSMPINLSLKNLVILNMSNSRITDKWKWWNQIKMAEKLKVLNLSHCNNLAGVPHLSNFAALESLQLNYCTSLRSLDGLERLLSLSSLSTSGCNALERLPDLSKLGKLRTLDVCGCWNLTVIQGLEKLVSLELLDTSDCTSLERLPNLSNLQKLTSFRASVCSKLTEIQGLDRLPSLEHFDMSDCSSLERLPDLSNLKKLRELNTKGWKVTEVQGLGELEFLEHLIVNENECLEILPDLSKLRRLRELKIRSCGKLIKIQGLHGLKSLEVFNTYECRSIERLTDMSNLKRLRKLEIRDCEELIEISDLDGVVSLEEFKICNCKSLVRLPNLSDLRKLIKLTIESLHRIVDIQGLERLESLEKLSIFECRSIERLPDLPNFGKLKDINLRHCTQLYEVESLRVVETLESLNLSSCEALGKILDLPNLKNLKRLQICSFKELTEIRGLEELDSLEFLNIQRCKCIANFPDLSNLKNLKCVYLN